MSAARVITDKFLRAIPKTDLHCHLDGSLRPQTLIDLAVEQNIALPTYKVEELDTIYKEHYNNLEEYISGFQHTCNVMRKPHAVERIAYELACDQFDDGVSYFEVRFAPQLCAVPGEFSIEQVLESADKGLNRAIEEYNTSKPQILDGSAPPFAAGIIVCAMRMFNENFSPYFKQFCEMHQHEEPHRMYGLASSALIKAAVGSQVPIVALDVAGAENGFPAEDHTDAYAYAHKHLLNKTVHAGESYGPESILQAVIDLHTERIGHGYHLFHANEIKKTADPSKQQEYVDKLVDYLAKMRIGIEVCLTSNLQTLPQLENDCRRHPMKQMLENNLAVTLCTDNLLVSRTNMVKEMRLAVDAFDLDVKQIKQICITGFKRSFMNGTYSEKQQYIKQAIAYFNKVEREFFN